MADKVFKTVKQQLSILRSRGMNIMRKSARESHLHGVLEPGLRSIEPLKILTKIIDKTQKRPRPRTFIVLQPEPFYLFFNFYLTFCAKR